MATVNPSVWTATNTTQDLFEISYPLPGVPQYDAVGPAVALTLDTYVTQVGSDIEIDLPSGAINLVGGITYQITVTADISGEQGFYQIDLYDGDTYTQVSPAEPGSYTLVTTVTPSVDTRYYIRVFNNSGKPWRYPSQVLNTSVTVQAVSGFEQ